MAWKTCKWCGICTNGYYLSERHARSMHPKEYAIEEAQERVHHCQEYLTEAETRLSEWRLLKGFLVQDMPALIRNILENAVKARVGRFHLDARTDEEFLVNEVSAYGEKLIKAGTELDAVEAQFAAPIEKFQKETP